jgi:hypothetical protein
VAANVVTCSPTLTATLCRIADLYFALLAVFRIEDTSVSEWTRTKMVAGLDPVEAV